MDICVLSLPCVDFVGIKNAFAFQVVGITSKISLERCLVGMFIMSPVVSKSEYEMVVI
jgi:hypothetical protein